jgi:hypothetical protein
MKKKAIINKLAEGCFLSFEINGGCQYSFSDISLVLDGVYAKDHFYPYSQVKSFEIVKAV